MCSQSAGVHPLPYMEGVVYMRSDFLHEHGSTFSVPETFLIPILCFYNDLSLQPHVFHVWDKGEILHLSRWKRQKRALGGQATEHCCFSGYGTTFKLLPDILFLQSRTVNEGEHSFSIH